MRNPKRSLPRVPAHYEVGSQFTDALEHIVNNRPEVADDVFKAIGDTTKTQRGPSDEVVQLARTAIKRIPGISCLGKLGVTEFHAEIYDRWVRMSGILIQRCPDGYLRARRWASRRTQSTSVFPFR